MTRIVINIILITAFTSLAIVISAPFFAEARFESAERLITGYLWKDAEAKLEQAIRIDTFNSRYPARLGEFLFIQAGYKDNKTLLLKKAEGYYKRAVRLNPRCAEYFVKLGQIDVSLFLEGAGAAEKRYIDKAFENFRKAIEDDPNGFNTAYAIGYSGLSVWKYLNESEKTIVVGRLKFALKQKPSYCDYVYSQLLRNTDDSKLLESITPDIGAKRWIDLKRIEDMKRDARRKGVSGMVSKSDWQGTASDVRNIYKDGNMYWTGTIYGAILLPKGSVSITIEAWGTPVNGVYPYMLLFLDDNRIGTAYIDSPEHREYKFNINTRGGVRVLGITFTNDGGTNKEDRNLFIGNARAEQR